MNRAIGLISLAGVVVLLAGCETTNSIPYQSSTTNVIAIQEALSPPTHKINVGTVEMAPGTDEHLRCRLLGPVKVAPGKTLSQYIKDALIKELFTAQAYDPRGTVVVNATISNLSFSSISPADWKIEMTVNSTKSPGYTVSVDYRFNTSWTAYSACKNVADAFGPAVQELIKQIVTNPGFAALAG